MLKNKCLNPSPIICTSARTPIESLASRTILENIVDVKLEILLIIDQLNHEYRSILGDDPNGRRLLQVQYFQRKQLNKEKKLKFGS